MESKVAYLVIRTSYDDLDTIFGVALTLEKAQELKDSLPDYDNLLSDIVEVTLYE
jgi:hypothetical protein